MTSIQIDIKDGLSSSTAIKGPCRVATTANITLSGEQTIDGVAVVTDDRVLVKDQTTASENGIYVADTGPWRRSKDFNKTRDVKTGTMVNVSAGTVGAGQWLVTTADPITIGTTSITFERLVMSASQLIDEDDMASNSATKVPSQQSVKTYVDGKTTFSVKTFGAVGDGTTDDTAAIQAALNAVKAAGGGALYFPKTSTFYKVTSGLTYNVSAETGRFTKRLVIKGDGPNSCVSMTGVASALLTITGNASFPEMHAHFEGIRLVGDNTVGSKGLVLSVSAFGTSDGLIIEAFDYCMDCTDVEQTAFMNSNFRWGIHGVRFNAAVSTTSANSLLFVNCAIANNSKWGAWFTNPNAVKFEGGSIQYNGTLGGGATEWGIKLTEAGNGYGTVLFHGSAIEGNGGDADVISEQTTYVASYIFAGCGFTRPNNTNYATNFLKIDGTAAATYQFTGSTWRGYNTYVADAGRPYIAVNNANALIFDDGNNVYGSALEQPAWAGAAKVPARLIVGVGGAPLATSPFVTHHGTDGNIYIGSKVNLADGLVVGSVNDANNVLKGFEIRASSVYLPATAVSGALTPAADDGGALGSIALKWSDLFVASGGVINFASGDVTITHAADVLAFAGAANGYTFSHAITPAANDGAALGSATVSWSDLFLASGAVQNFNNGNYTITHSAGTLTYSGGASFGASLLPTTNDVGALGSSTNSWADAFFAVGAVITFGGNDMTLTHAAGSRFVLGGNFGRGVPVTKTGNFTVSVIENWLIVNQAGTTTVTLPAAATWLGREIFLRTIQAQAVISASSNVVPLIGGAAGTAILAATAGKWATLVSDGTNWQIMQGN